MPSPKLLLRRAVERLESRDLPAVFVVTNTLDAGAGSLRQAVSSANSQAGSDQITFDPTVFATPKTIILATGEIAILDGLTITGPSASVTFSGNSTSRIFKVDMPTGSESVSLSNIRLVNGRNTLGDGGAIYCQDGQLILAEVDVVGNTCAGGFGGGIALASNLANLTMSDCTIEGNWAPWGGGINCADGSVMALKRCRMRLNYSNNYGGAISFGQDGSVSMDDCLVAYNSARLVGGGAEFSSSIVTLTNCTFANNTAKRGGAMSMNGGVPQRLLGCTISSNQASTNGGGLYIVLSQVTMESTIIGNNVAPSMPDIQVGTSLPITVNRCLIGNTSGAFLTGSNNLLNVDPLIDILRDNGGQSMTCLLLPGSPAIDAGSNPAGLQYDQRGVGFPRVVGAAADIGAAEGVLQIPVGQDITADVSTFGATTQTVTVKYFDAAGIAVGSLGTGDIVVEGPGGFSAVPIFDGVDVAGNGSPRVATYHFTPPGGSWDTPDNGTYTVRVVAGQVANINSVTAPAEQVGSFNVAVYTPINFVVTNTLDSGAGSLRQAVLDAKANLATDSITFAPLVAGTITLTSDLPILEDGMTIIGPGAVQLAITRPTGRVFEGKNLTLERLTIRDTDSSNATVDKGAVAGTGKLTLRDCSFINNFAYYPSAFGGAVYLNGELLAERCKFQGNSVTTGGGALAVGDAIIRDSSFSGNYIVSGIVATAGGAIYSSGTLLLEGCSFTGNSAPSNRADGGAIWFNGTSFTARNCLFAGNSARSGGALALFGPALLQNCTVVGNSASLFTGTSSPGGGIRATSLTLESTVVTGNSDNEAPDISASGVKASRSLIGSPLGFGYVDQGGNIPTGTPPQLDGSYVPLLTSPLINAGANPANLTNDVRGTGFARVRGKATDIGAYENQNVPATVSSVTINGGAAQRSRLYSVTVAFDRVLDLSGNPFRVARQSDGLPLTFTVTTAGTSATLTFTGATPVPDGRYTLQLLAAAIPGGFDGNGDVTPGDDYTLAGTPQNGLFRLYGDSNGDGRVDSTDFLAFRLGLSANNPIFDADGDGLVGAADFLQFRLRFLQVI